MSPDRLFQLQALIERFPDDELLWFSLGLELAKAERWEEAAQALEKAIHLRRAYTTAYRELGKAYFRLGNKNAAQRIFEQGLLIAEETGDLQVKKEITVLLRRCEESAG